MIEGSAPERALAAIVRQLRERGYGYALIGGLADHDRDGTRSGGSRQLFDIVNVEVVAANGWPMLALDRS